MFLVLIYIAYIQILSLRRVSKCFMRNMIIVRIKHWCTFGDTTSKDISNKISQIYRKLIAKKKIKIYWLELHNKIMFFFIWFNSFQKRKENVNVEIKFNTIYDITKQTFDIIDKFLLSIQEMRQRNKSRNAFNISNEYIHAALTGTACWTQLSYPHNICLYCVHRCRDIYLKCHRMLDFLGSLLSYKICRQLNDIHMCWVL